MACRFTLRSSSDPRGQLPPLLVRQVSNAWESHIGTKSLFFIDARCTTFMKEDPELLGEAAQDVLNVDSALFGMRIFPPRSSQQPRSYSTKTFRPSHSRFSQTKYRGPEQGPSAMEIGNVQGLRIWAIGQQRSHNGSTRRQRDLRDTACFICHKSGCRLWKHNSRGYERNMPGGSFQARANRAELTDQKHEN